MDSSSNDPLGALTDLDGRIRAQQHIADSARQGESRPPLTTQPPTVLPATAARGSTSGAAGAGESVWAWLSASSNASAEASRSPIREPDIYLGGVGEILTGQRCVADRGQPGGVDPA
jgi:hypothetical protein